MLLNVQASLKVPLCHSLFQGLVKLMTLKLALHHHHHLVWLDSIIILYQNISVAVQYYGPHLIKASTDTVLSCYPQDQDSNSRQVDAHHEEEYSSKDIDATRI